MQYSAEIITRYQNHQRLKHGRIVGNETAQSEVASLVRVMFNSATVKQIIKQENTPTSGASSLAR